MKFAAITAAALLSATSIQAAELGATGISIGATATSEYNVDAENMTVEFTPSLGYNVWGTDFTLSSDIAIYDDEVVLFDENPTIDFKIGYGIWDNAEVYVETGYDLEAEARTDVVVGASFSF